jgi:hypothetical protein
MEKMIQKQNRYLELIQHISGSGKKDDNSLYIAAFGGVAAGLTLALVDWLLPSIVASDDVINKRSVSGIAIHTNGI